MVLGRDGTDATYETGKRKTSRDNYNLKLPGMILTRWSCTAAEALDVLTSGCHSGVSC